MGRSNGKSRSVRLPRLVEVELAKFLNTIGFSDYGTALWNLATRSDTKASEVGEAISSATLTQVKDQARFDPTIIAAGEDVLAKLPSRRRTLQTCWGVTAPAIFDDLGPKPRAVLAVSRLDAMTIDKAAKILEGLANLDAGPCLVVVTDEMRDAMPVLAESKLRNVHIMFWRNVCGGHAAEDPRLFAMFVHAVGAPVFVSVSSALGFETIGRYGRALRRFHRLISVLEVPATSDRHRFSHIYYFRLTSTFAKILAFSDAEASFLHSFSEGLEARDIVVLPPKQSEARRSLAAIFGDNFEDQRSAVAQMVLPELLYGREAPPAASSDAAGDVAYEFDITVTIVFHREHELTLPALASLACMIEVANDADLKIEARAMLDRPDDRTRDLVRANGSFLNEIQEVDFGDLSLTRNAGTALARGRFLTFLDGDDLWGADWLRACHEAAAASDTAPGVIWHPASYFLFLASDCRGRSQSDLPNPAAGSTFYHHQTSTDADFEPRDLLLENLWTANAFAPTKLFRKFPYRPNDWTYQVGIEDWRWNLETLAAGIPHCAVPDTVHLIREKEGGSLGQVSDAVGLLPVLI